MMLTIHGFPNNTKYQDVKLLIKGECNINDFILDNLLSDTEGSKKVRVGLADNAEGYKVMKCLNGFRIQGSHVLKVVPVGKAVPAPPQPSSFDPRSGYPNTPRNDFSNQPGSDYISINPSNDYTNKGPHGHPGSHSQGGPIAPGGSRYGGYSSGSSGSYGQGPSGPSRGQHGQPNIQDNMGRPSPWASGSNTNQWSDNQPMAAQIPQNTFNYNSQVQNMNSSFVPQQHQHSQGPPRSEARGFNQDRSAPGPSGFPPKNVAPIPTNSRYRWNKSYLPEPKQDPAKETKPPPQQNKPNKYPTKLVPIDRDAIKDLRKKFTDGKLCGSARKRIFTWMKFGKTFQEALALCKTRLKDVPEYIERRNAIQTHRTHLALKTPLKPEPKQPKHPAEWTAPKAIAKQSKAFKVRIVDFNGPLTQEQVDIIQKTILERINFDENEDGPRFLGCYNRYGGLNLTCANPKSKEWLIEQVATMKPWYKAELVVVEQEKKLIAIAFVPDAEIKGEALINLLKVQNKDMNFSEWAVSGRKPEPSGQMVTFSIDEASLKPLNDRKFSLFLGLGKIQIRIKSKISEKDNPIHLPDTVLKQEQEQEHAQIPKSEPGQSGLNAAKSSKKKKKNRANSNINGGWAKVKCRKPTARSQDWKPKLEPKKESNQF